MMKRLRSHKSQHSQHKVLRWWWKQVRDRRRRQEVKRRRRRYLSHLVMRNLYSYLKEGMTVWMRMCGVGKSLVSYSNLHHREEMLSGG
jgi:hypothetical protein